MLYDLSMDSLSTQLLSFRIVFLIAGECVSHIACEDDMILHESPIKALQSMIDIGFKFAGENYLLYI